MILNSIFLYLDRRYFPADMCLKLKDQSRHITYRIQRLFAAEKYSAGNFNRIVIEPSLNPTGQIIINSESVANISIPFDMEMFQKSTDGELRHYHASLIKNGLLEFNRQIRIPIERILEVIDELESNNFIDSWIYKEKSIRKSKTKAKLTCFMDSKAFVLNLAIEKDGLVLHDGNILETPPDEVSFHYKFKDLVVTDDHVAVTQRIPRDEILIKVPLA